MDRTEEAPSGLGVSKCCQVFNFSYKECHFYILNIWWSGRRFPKWQELRRPILKIYGSRLSANQVASPVFLGSTTQTGTPNTRAPAADLLKRSDMRWIRAYGSALKSEQNRAGETFNPFGRPATYYHPQRSTGQTSKISSAE